MMGTRFATTIANPLGARQESAPMASVENIVTAVRRFSESLLTNQVSKEVQQEVKALAAHMEVLIARRRLAASKSKSPSVAETRLALKNLKCFLEREANKERAAKKKPSASCTTDTLESSCSLVQAFSPGSGRSHSLRSLPADNSCGDRGDFVGGRHSRELSSSTKKLRHNCNIHRTELAEAATSLEARPRRPPKRKERPQSPPQPTQSPPTPPPPLRGPAQLVRLTCSESQLPMLLMPLDEKAPTAAEEAISNRGCDIVHVATEWAQPLPPDASVESQMQLSPLLSASECGTPNSNGHLVAPALCLYIPPVRLERATLSRPNHPLEDIVRRDLEVAVERPSEHPVLMATVAPTCDGSSDGVGGGGIIRRGSFQVPGIGGSVAMEKAAVAEQSNINCASISSHVAIVSWAKAALRDRSDDRESNEPKASGTTTQKPGNSHQMVSTCSYPSDSDGRKVEEEEQEGKKVSNDSEDIQTSSAQIRQGGMSVGAKPHSSIQEASMRLEQRVCESCSPELPVSTTSVLTADEDPLGGKWQQPLFRIVDLVRLVRSAAPLGRSESPTEALEVAANPSNEDAVAEATVAAAVDGDSESGRSKSTLEVVDQSGASVAVPVAVAAPSPLADSLPAIEAAKAPAAEATTAAAVVPAATPPLGPTWSSCEVGQSSGFTKLLLTLDKAAKRRREQARVKRRPEAATTSAGGTGGAAAKGRRSPRSGNNSGTGGGVVAVKGRRSPISGKNSGTGVHVAAARGRRSSRSGNNSGGVNNRAKRRQHPPSPLTQSSPQLHVQVVAIRRQEEALKRASKSLAGLARSLQMCVRRVHDAADAINGSL